MGCPLCRNALLPSRWHLQLIFHAQLNRHHFYEAFFRHPYPSQSKSNFYALKGPLARDTSCLISPMGMDLALGTETIGLPEKKSAQRKQSQETERLNTTGRIQIIGLAMPGGHTLPSIGGSALLFGCFQEVTATCNQKNS